MTLPTPLDEADLDPFFEQLGSSGQAVLFLDYDGTLAPFCVDRDAAVPYPGVTEILEAMLGMGHTRLVMVSGRPVSDVMRLLNISSRPEIWGAHGMERCLPDGDCERMPLGDAMLQGLSRARAWAKAESLAAHYEEKPGSIAIHFRGLPARDAWKLEDNARAALEPIAEKSGLKLCPFDGGLELRPPHITKARTVNTVLSEMPAGTPAAYLGDDMTDEDAFRAIGRRGLSVLVRTEPRPSLASVWVRPPEQLLALLQRWHDSRLAVGT